MQPERRFAGKMKGPDQGLEAEDAFHELVDTIDAEARRTPGFAQILQETEDTDDYERGLVRLRQFLAQRKTALERISVRRAEAGREVSLEGVRQIVDEIRLVMSYPDRFLGNGASAEVVTLRKSPEERDVMVCAKVITNYERYAEGMRVADEMNVLDRLRDLHVEGVRTPLPLFAFSAMNMDGFAMEELDAVNFRRVLEGQTTNGRKDVLPLNFDAVEYFAKLRLYVAEMHKLGVVHNDLHLRNMMIDRATGLPRVIDFGKARLEEDLDKSVTSIEEEGRKDFEAINLAQAEVRAWLAAKA